MADLQYASAGGEMGERIRKYDWAASPMGARETWPSTLRVTLDLCLNSPFPMAIYWGPDLRLLYNDGWSPIPGKRHPEALGRPAYEVWSDIWPVVGPQFATVMETGCGYATSEQHLPMTRFGRLEESYWDYSFTPIFGKDGRVSGVLNQGHEVTARVKEHERHMLMLSLSDRLRDEDEPDHIVAMAVERLGAHMNVARAGYAEVDLAGGTFDIVANWRRDEGVPDVAGIHPVGAFGADLHQAMLAGAVFGVDDAAEDRRVQGQPVAHRYTRLGVRAGLVVPVLKGGAYAAAIFVHHDAPRYWTTHDERLLTTIAEQIWQERNRARAARALRESERRHRLIFEQANDIVFTAGLDQTITGANPAAGRALGVDANTLVGRSIGEFLSTEQFVRASQMLTNKLLGHGATRYEVAVNTGDGRTLQWEVNSTLATDDAGTPLGLHAIARDVTERHRHEQDQRRLIDELNHRVRNMLAQVQGLAQQTLRGDRPAAVARQAFQNRLGALSAAYDLLTAERWGSTTLAETIATGTRELDIEGARVSRRGPHVELSPKTAVSLVMAFHELATNARDHGALRADGGKVDIVWQVEGDRLSIAWRESGGPPVSAPSRRGFGLRMVERALASDLSARVTLDFSGDGFTCRIDAPLTAGDGSSQ